MNKYTSNYVYSYYYVLDRVNQRIQDALHTPGFIKNPRHIIDSNVEIVKKEHIRAEIIDEMYNIVWFNLADKIIQEIRHTLDQDVDQ